MEYIIIGTMILKKKIMFRIPSQRNLLNLQMSLEVNRTLDVNNHSSMHIELILDVGGRLMVMYYPKEDNVGVSENEKIGFTLFNALLPSLAPRAAITWFVREPNERKLNLNQFQT